MCIRDSNGCVHYCDMQTHLFEDRVFKCNKIVLGHDVHFSPLSLALPKSNCQDGVQIGPKSCVMQGETVPADTHWQGAPMAMVKKSKLQGPGLSSRHLRSNSLALQRLASQHSAKRSQKRSQPQPQPQGLALNEQKRDAGATNNSSSESNRKSLESNRNRKGIKQNLLPN
eukprot:TRINITY_DN9930_c0_g1_i1.p1 TRINITY_DN9930_c0_g1~~TRINITY_DN9930_c0_g1_i1.p1  ORF type:complete len:170 (+),score=25.45 TRINITY_DN9930_c0_g1_i1:125-634(+)